MATREELRRKESTAANGREVILIDHFLDVIGIIKEGLVVLLEEKWSTNMIMGVITMEIGVILIIKGDRPLIQVNFAENENNYSASEIERGDSERRNTDIVAEGHLPNHRADSEYRDSDRSGDYDVFETFTGPNSAMKYRGGNGRTIQRFETSLRGVQSGFIIPRKKRYQTNGRR